MDYSTQWSANIDSVREIGYYKEHLGLPLLMAGAAVLYSFRLGRVALGASEAYSAAAAAQPNSRAVVQVALAFDPGKPLLYHLLLHWFCAWCGLSEISLRAFSVIFAVLTVFLLYLLTRELFGNGAALCVAVVWSVNPLAIEFAQWARMYSMFLAFAIGHLWCLAKLRTRWTILNLSGSSLFGAAMLYTHLGGLLVLGAEAASGMHDWVRGRRLRTIAPLLISCVLFTPFLPTAILQTRALIRGHWLDWIGTPSSHISVMNLTILTAMAATVTYLASAPEPKNMKVAALRWCATLAIVPSLALVAASITIRPVFALRYVAPSAAVLAIAFGGALSCADSKWRNLGFAATAFFMVTLVPFCQRARDEPWRDFAAQVSHGGNGTEPVIFETGPFLEGTSAQGSDGFPRGFFRIPFDYYSHGANPRLTVPAMDPLRAQAMVQTALCRQTGAWLISGQGLARATAELPRGPNLHVESVTSRAGLLLIHLTRTEQFHNGAACHVITISGGPAT